MKNALIALFIVCTLPAFGQKKNPNRIVNCKGSSLNCPGVSLFHETAWDFTRFGVNSINVDFIVLCRESFMASVRAGISYLTFPKISAAGVPAEFNFLIGKSTWLIETGLGASYLYVYNNYSVDRGRFSDNVSYLAITGRLGIRYERSRSVFFRIGYTPMLSVMNADRIEAFSKHSFIHMASLGIGYTFGN